MYNFCSCCDVMLFFVETQKKEGVLLFLSNSRNKNSKPHPVIMLGKIIKVEHCFNFNIQTLLSSSYEESTRN